MKNDPELIEYYEYTYHIQNSPYQHNPPKINNDEPR